MATLGVQVRMYGLDTRTQEGEHGMMERVALGSRLWFMGSGLELPLHPKYQMPKFLNLEYSHPDAHVPV
jgi:hypothetical protein